MIRCPTARHQPANLRKLTALDVGQKLRFVDHVAPHRAEANVADQMGRVERCLGGAVVFPANSGGLQFVGQSRKIDAGEMSADVAGQIEDGHCRARRGVATLVGVGNDPSGISCKRVHMIR